MGGAPRSRAKARGSSRRELFTAADQPKEFRASRACRPRAVGVLELRVHERRGPRARRRAAICWLSTPAAGARGRASRPRWPRAATRSRPPRRGGPSPRAGGASLVSTAVLYQRLPTVIYGLADQGVDAPADLLMTTPGCSEGRVTPTDVAAPSVSCRVGAAGPAGDRGRSGRPRAPGRPGCAGPSCTGSGTYGRARPAIGRRSGRVAATASAGVPVR